MESARIAAERGRKYLGVNELAEAAARLLYDSGLAQERGTVSAVPDERTIRYYLAEGLLTPSRERHGATSVFGYLQLLQILAIKKWQAEHLSIRHIKEALVHRTIDDLERLLGLNGAGTADNEATRFLEGLLNKPAPDKKTVPAPNFSRNKPTVIPSLITQPVAWRRHELTDGLELHIREDFPSLDREGRRRIAEAVRVLLKIYSEPKI